MKHKSIIVIATVFSLFFFSSLSIVWGEGFSITGMVFDDKNCNGQRNAVDSGVSGVMIKLNTGPSTTTASNGTYSFSGLPASTYVVTEILPSGYCSTTPLKKTISLVKKDINNQNFGISKLPASPGGDSCCVD